MRAIPTTTVWKTTNEAFLVEVDHGFVERTYAVSTIEEALSIIRNALEETTEEVLNALKEAHKNDK